jgi:glutamate-1-semialdehyde 2,1-aminomutase
MSEMTLVLGLAAAFAAAIVLATHLFRRASVALLTIRARSWVSAVSRILSEWVNATHYSGDAFFSADGADARTVRRRSAALDHLAASFASAHAKSTDWGRSVRDGFSDIRFADANRVPFPFARTMREKFDLTTVVTASDGPRLCDLDGQWSLDVSGSYGVNVGGFERYKRLDPARMGSCEGTRSCPRTGASECSASIRNGRCASPTWSAHFQRTPR